MIKKTICGLVMLGLILLLIVCGIVFFFVFSIISTFITFDIVSETTGLIIVFVISGTLIVGIITLFVLYFMDKLPNRFNAFVKENLSIILTAIFFFMLFLMSIKNEVYITQSKAESIMPVLWGIFGISVSIFVLWNTILEKSSNIDNQEKAVNARRKYAQILAKQERRVKLKDSLVNIIYFSVNMISLCFASACVYLTRTEIGLLEQCVLSFAFYVSTNTLVTVLNNVVITPTIKKIYNQIKDNKVSQKELDKAKEEANLEQLLYQVLEVIIDNKIKNSESPNINESQKEVIIDDIISTMQDDTKNNLIDLIKTEMKLKK